MVDQDKKSKTALSSGAAFGYPAYDPVGCSTPYEKQDREYDQQEAKEMFEQMAEEALQKCDMAPLNPRYRLDFVLLSCFGDTEMSYLSEILCEYIQPEEE